MKADLEPHVSLSTPKSVPGVAEASFATLRFTLARIAYRMLGSVADAEDIVQETFVRWMQTDRARDQAAKAVTAVEAARNPNNERSTFFGYYFKEESA